MWGDYFCMGAYKLNVAVAMKVDAYTHGAYFYGCLLFPFYSILVSCLTTLVIV